MSSSGWCRGRPDKIGTLRIKAHNFDIINVKKKLKLGVIRVNSLLNNSTYPIILIEEQIQKNNDLKYDPFLRFYPEMGKKLFK